MGRVWTIEERQKQAERIRSQKPWLKSTGPRTTRGKIASSRNAMRHGCYGTEFKMLSLYLKMQKHYIDTLRFMLKHDLFIDETPFEISGNELNENPIKSIQNDTDRCVKNTIKSMINSPLAKHNQPLQPQSSSSNRHCEERSDEAIQNGYDTLDGLPRFARNDNHIRPPYPHPHKNNHSKELCDSLSSLCLCGERPSVRKLHSCPVIARNIVTKQSRMFPSPPMDCHAALAMTNAKKNPPFLTGLSKILSLNAGRWRLKPQSASNTHPPPLIQVADG